jgi:hypothetical protein
MADRSSNVLTDLADRRSALRILGAASTAVLATLGLGGISGEARGRGGPGKGKGKSDRNQRTQHTRHPEGTSRLADGGDEPAAPVDDASSPEPVKNASVTAQRKRRRSIRVVGDVSGPLPATNGAQVFSRAFCPGGDGKLLGGGYNVNGTPEQLENLIVVEAAPDGFVGTFTATLRRTSGSGSAGATITAFAICKA